MSNALERQFKLAQVRQAQKPVFPTEPPPKPKRVRSAEKVVLSDMLRDTGYATAMFALPGTVVVGALVLVAALWVVTSNVIVVSTIGGTLLAVAGLLARAVWKMIHR